MTERARLGKARHGEETKKKPHKRGKKLSGRDRESRARERNPGKTKGLVIFI